MCNANVLRRLTLVLCTLFAVPQAVAQDAAGDQPAGADAQVELVKPSFPDDTTLQVLADYVAQRLELNLIYNKQDLTSKKVTIRSSVPIPVDSLRELLSGQLRANQLAMVETDVPGTFRIAPATALAEVAGEVVGEGQALPEGAGGRVVTRVFSFEHTTAERINVLVEKFLSKPGASSLLIKEQNLLVVNDYAGNMQKLEEIIALADRPLRSVKLEMVPIKHMSAEEMGKRVQAVLKGRDEAQLVSAGLSTVRVVPEAASNKLAVFAGPSEMDQVQQLIASLDVASDFITEVYRLKVADAKRVDKVMESILGADDAERLYRSNADEQTNELVVTTTAAVHARLAELVTKLDEPRSEEESPIRFYKLENADAQALLETIKGIRGSAGVEADRGSDGIRPPGDSARINDPDRFARDSDRSFAADGSRDRLGGGSEFGGSSDAGEGGQGGALATNLPDARIIADASTNTLIVVASPSVQPFYEQLIQKLDVRLPQVLLEVTIVALDTTDNFSLGVEFSKSDGVDGGRLLNFTQFGLSTADDETGVLSLNPGIGFNSALLGADTAEIVLQALKTDIRSAILTTPQILINDNQTGVLLSEDEEPIETNVITGGGVAQNSFGGFATAGTKIEVKPSISDGDHLKLDYDINVSTFGDTRVSDSLPPSRQTSQLTSVATIPDGHTIVVGGLTREVDSETVSSIPLLGQIPIIKHAFSSRTNNKRQVTLFIFLRPVILRDDKFEDLKVLSGTAAGKAQLPSQTPTSLPVEIR